MNTSRPVNLQFSAYNLPDKDILSKSDPQCIVYEVLPKVPLSGYSHFKPEKDNYKCVELLRTSVIQNDLNPIWQQVLTTSYKFEQEQWLYIQVIDVDSKHNKDIAAQDFLGSALTTVGNIVSNQINGGYTILLRDAKNQIITVSGRPSSVTIKANFIEKSLQTHKFNVYLKVYKSKQWRDSPFLQVLNKNRQIVYESAKRHNPADNYVFEIKDTHLLDYSIWKFANKHKESGYIGEVKISYEQLLLHKDFDIKNYKGDISGLMQIKNLITTESKEDANIVDYLTSGNKISCIIAYDFTGSNGNPKEPGSLHSLSGNNQYINATESIVSVLDQYDDDKNYPVYAYGMSVDGNPVDHAKKIIENAYCADGVIGAYRTFLHTPSLVLSGPTVFAPIINEVCKQVEDSKDTKYTVLTMFTDGGINDMKETIEAIVRSTYLPISIIIVGIGDANFDSMNILDNDGPNRLRYNDKYALRDNVQFVPFRDCKNIETIRMMTLAELPNQICEYQRLVKKL
jgi:hypothetical protein